MRKVTVQPYNGLLMAPARYSLGKTIIQVPKTMKSTPMSLETGRPFTVIKRLSLNLPRKPFPMMAVDYYSSRVTAIT